MLQATPNRRVFFCSLAGACVAALAMPGFAAAQPPAEWDGLVLRPSSAVDMLYVRTEASLEGCGYEVVTEADEDVLDVAPFIVDLMITVPDRPTGGRTRTFTANAGQMTLVAELRDSETGQILMRVIDNQRARSTGTFQWTTSVTNMGEARQIITGWAATLRRQLDAANGR